MFWLSAQCHALTLNSDVSLLFLNYAGSRTLGLLNGKTPPGHGPSPPIAICIDYGWYVNRPTSLPVYNIRHGSMSLMRTGPTQKPMLTSGRCCWYARQPDRLRGRRLRHSQPAAATFRAIETSTANLSISRTRGSNLRAGQNSSVLVGELSPSPRFGAVCTVTGSGCRQGENASRSLFFHRN